MSTTNMHDFGVSLRPLMFAGDDGTMHETDKFAIVRADNMKNLGVVSSRYSPLTHGEAATIVDAEMETFGQKYTVETALDKRGAIMHRSYIFKDTQLEVKKGDIVGMKLRILNGIDGKHGFAAYMDGLRLVCTNGMISTKEFYSVSIRHYMSGMNHDTIREFSRGIFDSFKDLVEGYKLWANEKITDERAELILQLLPKRMCNKSLSAFGNNADGTKWGLYNTMTFVNSHQTMRKTPNSEFAKINNGAAITRLMNNKKNFNMDIDDLKRIVERKRQKEEEIELIVE